MVAGFGWWFLVFALLILLKDAEACDRRCRKFTFCILGGKPFTRFIRRLPLVMHAPSTGSYPFICRRDGIKTSHIRVVQTGEALVSQGRSRRAVRISRWKPAGSPAPNPPFPKNYFGAFDIPLSLRMQGVGRVQSRGNQESFIDGLCVRLPIKSSFPVDSFGFQNGPIKSSSRFDRSSCISFQVKAPELVADFFWSKESDSRELDVDLFLTDINGNPLNIERIIGRSTTCVGCRTLYVPSISPGEYKVGFTINTNNLVVRHVNNGISHSCPGPIKGTRRFLTSRQPGSGALSIVNALLHVSVRGILVSDQTELFQVNDNEDVTGFFAGIIRVDPLR